MLNIMNTSNVRTRIVDFYERIEDLNKKIIFVIKKIVMHNISIENAVPVKEFVETR